MISTSHSLAKALLSKPDGFIVVTIGGVEYVISNIQRQTTHANIDDSVSYWAINVRDGGQGNIKI